MRSKPLRPPRARRKGFIADDTGAVFLEFLIVLFPFMFIMFGVIQIGLIAIASFYTNYANFMALRTAAVLFELKEDGLQSDFLFREKCVQAAMSALQPLEHFWYHHKTDAGAVSDLRLRTSFTFEANGGSLTGPSGSAQQGRPAFIKGHTEYKYYLIVPFANRVFGAFDRGIANTDDNRVMQEMPIFVDPVLPYPTMTIRSSDDLEPGSSPPFKHKMIIQRRWLYGEGTGASGV